MGAPRFVIPPITPSFPTAFLTMHKEEFSQTPDLASVFGSNCVISSGPQFQNQAITLVKEKQSAKWVFVHSEPLQALPIPKHHKYAEEAHLTKNMKCPKGKHTNSVNCAIIPVKHT